MDDPQFEELIQKALDNLPGEFKEKLENVSIVVSEWPTINQGREQVKRGERGLLLGLYEGVPHTKRINYGVGGVLPDKITIFKLPILIISNNDPSLIESNVTETVIHEIAHHFGISDETIDKIKKT